MAKSSIEKLMSCSSIQKMDLYLLDQIFKGRLNANQKILDVGSGKGRNLLPLLKSGFTAKGIDTEFQDYQKFQSSFVQSSIENFEPHESFDFIISNAVYHFSRNHQHFKTLFEKSISLLNPKGILFIRMTSNIGILTQIEIGSGIYQLKDASKRYLISREQISELCDTYNLRLIEPVKTTMVEDLRSMATIVLQKI